MPAQRATSLTMKRRVAVACIAVLCLFALPGATARADEGWTIERFHADIAVQQDSSIQITESIDVDFGQQQKHGIFREIPVRYSYDDTHDRTYQLDLNSVTDAAGTPWHFERSINGANVQVKIGDANRLISGRQTYRIAYRVRGALNAFPDHDELFWNVNGADWPVRTLETSATVRLPSGGLTDATCFEGPAGSKEPCNVLKAEDRAGFVSAHSFAEGEQLTIVTAIRKGAVVEPTLLLTDKPKTTVEQYFEFTPAKITAALAILIASIAVVAALWWRAGRDRVYTSIYYLSHDPTEATRPMFYRDAVVVEYTPPDDLLPAQMGLLLDQRADTKDVTATIIHLAVRGYLTIEELDKSWVFGSKDWKLTKKKDADGLQPFEQTIFTGLFESGPEVELSDIKKKYAGTLSAAEDQLYEDSVRRQWFTRNPESARNSWSFAGIAIIAAGAGAGYLLGRWWGAAILGVPVGISGALMLLCSRLMPRRTAKGSEALRRVLGFRLYVDTAETDRQKFNEQANIFAAYLPYAIVFGSVDKWARAFRDIDTKAATQGWYISAYAFSALDFSRSIETFSSTVSSVISSTPGSSGGSGFGGGGFSGGGGGGGGGGSW